MSKMSFTCKTHSEELITNYCCILSCQTPLCPECIDEHNKMHKKQNVFPEIDTINRVKTMCSNKLVFTSKTLEDLLNKLNNAKNLNLDDILQTSLQDLEKHRLRVIEQVNIYFKQIQDEFVS